MSRKEFAFVAFATLLCLMVIVAPLIAVHYAHLLPLPFKSFHLFLAILSSAVVLLYIGNYIYRHSKPRG